LFTTLSDIALDEEKDSILWRWIASGKYTTASAYDIQFLGAYPMFNAPVI
jgi:hypothetical protein